jgi:eukaryotic-like serine/threonine-protein kinase
LGQYEKCLAPSLDTIRLSPGERSGYRIAFVCHVAFNRLDEAEVVIRQAEEHGLADQSLIWERYQLAFLNSEMAKMGQLVSTAMGKPGSEDLLLADQADTEGWYGKLKSAHELTRRAMDSAEHNDAKETAASYQASAALREAESGNRERARADANAASKLGLNRDMRATAALALARAGDTVRAEKLAAELDKTYPLDTLIQRYWLPTIRAAVALERKDSNGAIELLKATSAIELGASGNLYPVYVRGEAYLMLHDGNAAAAEFQKLLDHRGLVGNYEEGALARLGLARAYALQGDTAKARSAYHDFLALWKDADPDIPVLIAAKAEYAKLK